MQKAVGAQELQQITEAVRTLVKGEQIENGLICPTTDEFLIRFIKASNYDVDTSFHLVKRYFKAKIEEPESFIVQSPAQYIKMLQRTDMGIPLLDKDKCGRVIFHIRFGLLDPSKEDWTSVVQTCMIMVEAYSLQKDVQDNGVAFIVNCDGFSVKLMKWATPHKLKIALAFFQDCIPLRFECIHLINYPSIFSVFYNMLAPFIHENIKRKMIWHRDLSSMEKYIHKKSLPDYLGGEFQEKDNYGWYKMCLENEEVFAEFRKMGYEKRNKSRKTNENA